MSETSHALSVRAATAATTHARCFIASSSCFYGMSSGTARKTVNQPEETTGSVTGESVKGGLPPPVHNQTLESRIPQGVRDVVAA